MSARLEVVSLQIYPIKSCGGIDLRAADIGPRGFLYDREWMWVDANGRFLTQRQRPEMVRVATRIESDALILSTAGQTDLRVPLKTQAKPIKNVEVWTDHALADDEGDEAAKWIKSAIGLDARLVRMASDFERKVNPKYGIAGAHTGFADSLPFLLTTEESLKDLNSRLASPVPMDRFRPNIVVRGGDGYEEDGWRRIRLGGVEFDVSKDCIRCVIITIDQQTGQGGKEPLKTLSTYRRDGTKVRFGRNMIHLSNGRLSVGDRGEILSTV